MPYYFPLSKLSPVTEKKRIIGKLLDLRLDLKQKVPVKMAQDKLLIATWNLREFSKRTRIEEAYYYMAEIIDSFDLVALQEIGSDLASLENLKSILGFNWNYIVTDSTAGDAGGGERLAFLYDTRKVHFKNIAGEIVLPEDEMVDGQFQFARTPFCVAFQAGWFRFMICSVHIYFGEVGNLPASRRAKEVAVIAQFLKKRAEKENCSYILIGDFNITASDDVMVQSLKQGGFRVPTALQQFASGNKRQTHYDQIAFNFQEKSKYILFSETDPLNADAFNYYNVVMKEEEFNTYKKFMDPAKIAGKNETELKKYYKSWRTFQMSDHLPIWVELKVDFSDEYLRNLIEE